MIEARRDPCNASPDGFHHPVWVEFQYSLNPELLCDYCALPLNEEVWG